jgi:hypothetical protein
MTVYITDSVHAIPVYTFGDLLNLLDGSPSIEITSNNEQLRTWSPFKLEAKIREITGLAVKVERV